jgi:hypothetical protein
MDTNEHLERLRAAREHAQNAGSRRSVEYLLGRRHGDGEYEYGKLSLSEPIVYGEFTEILTTNITDLIHSITEDQKPVVEFDIRHSNKNRTPIQVLEVSKLPSFAKLQDISAGTADLDTTTYDENEEDLEIEVIRVKAPSGKSVLGIQEYSSKHMLGSSMWTQLVKRPGQQHYDQFEQQVIGIPEKVRAIVYDGYLYSSSPKALERIFDFEDEYEEEVTEVLDGFSDQDIQLDIDGDLKETLQNDVRHLRKFHEMKALGIHKKATQEDIQRIVDERDLPVYIERQNGTMKLSVNSGHDRWELLDLLADDHVVSEMTDNPYNADGKELVDD